MAAKGSSRRRDSGELSSGGDDRHPWDWYVEEQWVTHRLIDMIGAELDPGATYLDPFCGMMNIPTALADRGFRAWGSDIERRCGANAPFLGEHDFLGNQVQLLDASPQLSLIFNPPFSYQDGRLVRGLAERCVRKALSIATHDVCALLPLKWLASQGRVRLFNDLTPAGIWVLGERPSMPPGHLIGQLGDNAFDRGKVDFMWVHWSKRRPPQRNAAGRPFAPTYWIPPRDAAAEMQEAA